MKNGKFVYTKPGSDDVIGEVEVATGFYILSRLVLSKNGVKYPDSMTICYLAGLIAGEEAGIEGVKIGDLKKVDEMKVARAMCSLDIEIVEPDGEDAPAEVSEVDENPTGTSGANC